VPGLSRLLGLAVFAAGLAACPQLTEDPEELSLSGTLDRESIFGSDAAGVVVSYRSEGARGEWWPCDARLTAQGCVGDHHVNVYISLPSVTDLGGVGTAACVSDDSVYGIYELFEESSGGTYNIGSELSVFIVVASDTDDTPGADLGDAEESTAATTLTSGTVGVFRWAGEDFLGLEIEGTTAEGRAVSLRFTGPMSTPGVVPTLEGPSTCVESALLDP
jgi:hypothetical protein